MNPFKMRPERTGDLLVDWEKFWVKPYNKNEVNPYTRTRIILMNGTEFENVWFSHQFSRSVGDDELRRKLAYIRKSEQQQQKILTHLKPADESALEHTIGYEQLAVDLTAHLAKRVNDKNIKSALDFALLEDFDHLYRYADYLDFTTGEHAEKLVGGYTEITPGRPTISHHRHPYDSIRYPMTDKCPATMDVLAANVITAAEQQTMNYYMNTAALWPDEMGRRLYQEIGMVEEQHVTQYGSLLKPCMSRLENLLVHQYVECWLYWSCYETETDTRIRGIWQFMFEQELKHLHIALELLRQYEKKDWQEVIPDAEFPAPLVLESNIEYVRCVLGSTVNDTACRERYVDVRTNAPETFIRYQRLVNDPVRNVMSHTFIEDYIRKNGDIKSTRPIEKIGAHAKGFNRESIGICYEGGLDSKGRPKDTRTEWQKHSLRVLILTLLKDYPGCRVCGHRDLSPDRNENGETEPEEWVKACPCFDAENNWKA